MSTSDAVLLSCVAATPIAFNFRAATLTPAPCRGGYANINTLLFRQLPAVADYNLRFRCTLRRATSSNSAASVLSVGVDRVATFHSAPVFTTLRACRAQWLGYTAATPPKSPGAIIAKSKAASGERR